MQLKAPSPSMGVALAALVLASTGTAVAAVSYANNAGKVDGRDAVTSKSSLNKAAGALVATAGAGPNKGKLPGRFVSGVVQGDGDTFSRFAEVQDNASDVPGALTSVPSFGTFSATCGDQNGKAGTEDPITTITYSNTSGASVDQIRSSNGGVPEVGVVPANAISVLNFGGTSAFHWLIQRQGDVLVVDGAVRQDNRNTGAAQCYVYGYAQVISNTR